MSTVEKNKKVVVTPFVVEADTPRNGDVIVQCIGNIKLRGAVSASVDVYDKTWPDELDEGEEEGVKTRPMGASVINGVGELPGEQLFINPVELTWQTKDPLRGEESKMERIAAAMKQAQGSAVVGQKLRGNPPRSGKIDPDMMKSLCREVLCFIVADEMKMVKGIKPSPEDVDDLPGEYLLNPANISKWSQPRYEKDYEPWKRKMDQLEGET